MYLEKTDRMEKLIAEVVDNNRLVEEADVLSMIRREVERLTKGCSDRKTAKVKEKIIEQATGNCENWYKSEQNDFITPQSLIARPVSRLFFQAVNRPQN